MFTGLIQKIGVVHSFKRVGLDGEIRVEADFPELAIGESIAVDGTCLTVAEYSPGGFTAGVSAETLARTTLGGLKSQARVHLERALKWEERLGGHIVSGHVDGVAIKTAMEPMGQAVKVTYEVPATLAPFIAPKGAVAVDGTSLTVNRAEGARFDVLLVPFTRSMTLLDKKPVGSPANVEVDLLAKYIARLLGKPGVDGLEPGRGVTLELLAKHGFL